MHTEPGSPPPARVAIFPAFPELTTPRLRLREITADDLDWYLEHFSQPEIVRGTGFPPPADRDAAMEELHRYVLDLFEAREGLRWGLTLHGERRLIGSAGLFRWVDEPVPTAELGYDLDPAWWGRGLMTEALGAILDVAFGRMRLARVEALVFTSNEASLRLLDRLGFTREALLPAHGEDASGVLRDDWRCALEAGAWKRPPAGAQGSDEPPPSGARSRSMPSRTTSSPNSNSRS